MSTVTTALAARLKNRTLPNVDAPVIDDNEELRRFAESVKEHLRMYEGDSGAPKERFVTIDELELAGLVTTRVDAGFASIAEVLGEPVPTVPSQSSGRAGGLGGPAQQIIDSGGGEGVNTFVELLDTSVTGITVGQGVVWNGSALVPVDFPSFSLGPATKYDMLYYDGFNWVSSAQLLQWNPDMEYLQLAHDYSINWLDSAGDTYPFLDFTGTPGVTEADYFAANSLPAVIDTATFTSTVPPATQKILFAPGALISGDTYLIMARTGCVSRGTVPSSPPPGGQGNNGNVVAIDYGGAGAVFARSIMFGSPGPPYRGTEFSTFFTVVADDVSALTIQASTYDPPGNYIEVNGAYAYALNLTHLGLGNYFQSAGSGAGGVPGPLFVNSGASLSGFADGTSDYLLLYEVKAESDSRFTIVEVALTGGPWVGDEQIAELTPSHSYDMNDVDFDQIQVMGMMVLEAPSIGTTIQMRARQGIGIGGPSPAPAASILSSKIAAIRLNAFAEHRTAFTLNTTDPPNSGEQRIQTINFVSSQPDSTEWGFFGGLHDSFPGSGFSANPEINADINTGGDQVVAGTQNANAERASGNDNQFLPLHVYPVGTIENVDPVVIDNGDSVEVTLDVDPAPNQAGEVWGSSSLAVFSYKLAAPGSTEEFTVGNESWPTRIYGTEIAIQGPVTAESYDGIDAMDLLSRSADESVSGGWDFSNFLLPPVSTTAELEDISDPVNTDDLKVRGSYRFNTTTGAPVWAAGNADGDVWLDATGATAHTPV